MKAVQEVSAPSINTAAKHWAVLTHLCVLVNIPLLGLGLLGPLFIQLIHRKDSFITEHTRTVLNFWLTMAVLMSVILGYLWMNEGSGRDELVPLFILSTVVVFQIVTSIFYGIAGIVQASRGLTIRYPLAIPFLRR